MIRLSFWVNASLKQIVPTQRFAMPFPYLYVPPAMEDLVKALRENGIEVDGEDYLHYRKHLMERYQSKPQFDPKDFFE